MSQNSFHYRLIKARVAETIINELFHVSGFNVFDYSIDRSMLDILKSLTTNK